MIQSGLRTSYRPQSGAQNSWVLWNNKQLLPAYFIIYTHEELPDFGGVLWRWLYWNVVYCILSASAVKNVTLVAYSFYSWADHRRLLLSWPSVSSLIDEKRFLNFFLNFWLTSFILFFVFVSGQREEFWRIQFWVESQPNLWMETNVGWFIDFFHNSLFWFSIFLN